MQVFRKVFVAALFILCGVAAQAQLKVDTTYTIEDMVSKVLMGKGVQVGNIQMKGSKAGIGYFHVNSDVLGMRNGLLLSTGKVHDAIGPNDVPGRSGIVTTSQTLKSKNIGDSDLNRLCGSRTMDVMVVEFDFIPVHNKVTFRYSFGSEEYREYVGSRFNDVFGFFIEGADLPKKNLAVIPGTDEPVAVNNVNHNKYRKIYLNNDYFADTHSGKDTEMGGSKASLHKVANTIFASNKTSLNENAVLIDEREKKRLNQELVTYFQYDGFTKVLTAECYVTPHKKYHLKLAIGDVGDYALDSGVFLEAGSFSSENDPKVPVATTVTKDSFDDNTTAFVDRIGTGVVAGNKSEIESIPTTRDIELFRITNVYFDTDSYLIPDSSKAQLDLLAAYLYKNKNLSCQIVGHTDNVGSKTHNQQLSEHRAVAVIKYLISKGITYSRLSFTGYNFESPIADNSRSQGRSYNRRVEVTVIDPIQASRQ